MDQNNTISPSAPIAALLPIVNSKQQLLALCPSHSFDAVEDVRRLLAQFQALGFFERQPDVALLLQLRSVAAIPCDWEELAPAPRLMLSLPEIACASEQAQAQLRQLETAGVTILVAEVSAHPDPLWKDTKAIAVDCSNGVPFFIKPKLTALGRGMHWASQIGKPGQLQEASDAGFAMFSGSYVFTPQSQQQTSDVNARARLLKLLGLVARDADSRELEELFKQDANLSFSLFKLVSSAAFAQTVKVSSFGQAINLLGRRQLQRWLQLLLYARQQDTGGALNPLMPHAAFRASLMEAVCQKTGGTRDEQDGAFMAGMFSLLDLLFGLPLGDVLRPLNLNETVSAALLQHSGGLGAVLDLAESADGRRGQVDQALLSSVGLEPQDYYSAVLTAYEWVGRVCQEV